MNDLESVICERCCKQLPPPNLLGNDGLYVYLNLYVGNRTGNSHGMHCYFCPDCGKEFIAWLRPGSPAPGADSQTSQEK